MGKFLEELHKKPDHHKKRFALMFSATITLFIFGIWSLTTFGISDRAIVASNVVVSKQENVSDEVGPLESMRMSLASSFEGIRNSFGALKNGLKNIEIESEYSEIREKAFDTYGEQ